MRAMYRWEVPVDDRWHDFTLSGGIAHVGSRQRGVVEFWAMHDDQVEPGTVALRAFGTGHELPAGSIIHRGAVYDASSRDLVWHLVETCPVQAGGCGRLTCTWCVLRPAPA